jgi:5-methylcytosine-specific restriction endonuclease McrA
MAEALWYRMGACANCDAAVTVKTPLFCSQRCRQEAELVRYVRGCVQDGRDQHPDVKEAIHTRLAMVLSGGYPERERQVPAATRAEVFRRAENRCESCGRPLDFDRTSGDADAIATIQHVHGNSNDVSDLKAFCRRCNLADAQERFVPVQPGSEAAAKAAELRERWLAVEPLRLCDDAQQWRDIWQELTRDARAWLGAHVDEGENTDE